MSDFLDSMSDADLRNEFRALLNRVTALEQRPVQVDSVDQIAVDLGEFSAFLLKIMDGDKLRMLFGGEDLFDLIGVHAHWSGFDDSQNPQVWLNAILGSLDFAGGAGRLSKDGLLVNGEFSAVQFSANIGSDQYKTYLGFMYMDAGNPPKPQWGIMSSKVPESALNEFTDPDFQVEDDWVSYPAAGSVSFLDDGGPNHEKIAIISPDTDGVMERSMRYVYNSASIGVHHLPINGGQNYLFSLDSLMNPGVDGEVRVEYLNSDAEQISFTQSIFKRTGLTEGADRWKTYLSILSPPSDAAYYTIEFWSDGDVDYPDLEWKVTNISVKTLSGLGLLTFEPEPTFRGSAVNFAQFADQAPLPESGRMNIHNNLGIFTGKDSIGAQGMLWPKLRSGFRTTPFGASNAVFCDGAVLTSAGTLAKTLINGQGYSTKFTTSTSNSAYAGWTVAALTTPINHPKFGVKLRTGSSIATMRYEIGFYSSATFFFYLAYDTTLGSANWLAHYVGLDEGIADTFIVDLGVGVEVNTDYIVELVSHEGSVHFLVNGDAKFQHPLPLFSSGDTPLQLNCRIQNKAASAHHWYQYNTYFIGK